MAATPERTDSRSAPFANHPPAADRPAPATRPDASAQPPAPRGTSAKAFNPFYGLLVVAGVLFALTASAYGLMTLRKIEPAMAAGEAEHPLIRLMDEHGMTALMVELGVLAVATVAAISTDSWWTARQLVRAGHARAVHARDDSPTAGRSHLDSNQEAT